MNRSTSRLLLLTTATLLFLSASAFAIFNNGGFETGDFTGWTKSTFVNNGGLTGPQPYSGSSIQRSAGGADRTTLASGATMSQSDGIVSAVQYPRFGLHAGLVNYWPANGVQPARNANTLLQQSTVSAGDVDPADGLVHVRFAFLPVLEDGGHTPTQQAYFYVAIRNVTKGAIVWQRFNFAAEAGVPWQVQPVTVSGNTTNFYYTPWQLVDASGGPGVIDIGDTLEIEVIAAGCNQGGHRGHVYVDAFGATIPGASVVATAPASTVPNAALTYNLHVDNDGTSTLANTVVSIAVPAQTTFASVSDGACSHTAGVVTCNFGSLAAGSSIDFDLTVTVGSGAAGNITLGNYGIAGTGYPTLLGPTRTTAVNAPVTAADSYTTNEDTPRVVAAPGVLANDTDPNGDALTVALVTGPAHGTLTLNANGSFTYTPAANYFGPDSFIYRASDGTNLSQNTNVLLTVSSVPDAPVATANAYPVNEDATLTVAAAGVLANDTDADPGTTLTAVLVSGPSHGVLTLNADGSFTYTPTANYAGADSFTYRANDGGLDSNVATVSITVNNVNDAPTATADTYSTNEDTPLSVSAAGVLGNDADIDTGAVLTAVLISGPAHGTLTLNPNGSFVYTPTANYSGPDGFVYRASDGTAQSANTAVTLNVISVPDAPTATNDGTGGTFTINEDGSLTVPAPGVLGNDVDPDGDPLTATLVTGPAHGTLTLNPNGSFVYTPAANYAGPDSFTYTVSDGTSSSAPATVSLNVTAVNDPPTAVANSYAVGEDHTLTVPAVSGLLANDSDVDDGALTALLVTGPAHGTLTLNPDGSFTYQPTANFNGTDTFTYQVSDGHTTSAPVTVTLTVGDDITLVPGAGRYTGGTRVTVEGSGFGPAGTPATVTIGGIPALDAEVLDDTHITFVTPALPANTPVDVVVAVNGGTPETLVGAYLPLPVPAPVAGDAPDTDGDGITDELELKYGLDPTNPADASEDSDHDGVPSSAEIVQGTHPNAPYLRYFAEGMNNTVFNTGIAIANASPATNEVQVTFFRQGHAPIRRNVTLAGKTRMMLNTATVTGMADAAFGVEIAGNEAVTADRTTLWDLGGREAHSEHAVEASPTWYFAEGATTGRFSLFYLVTNPGSQPANATVTFLRQVGTPIVKQVVVPAFARVTIPVNTADPGLASADVGGIVTADRPIVVERSMYLSSPTKIWEAGTGGTGVTAPSNRWFFGEGATGEFFDAWILLSNPGSTDSTVTVRYVADSGADVTRTHTVPAGRRTTIRVVDEDPAMMNTSFATFVTSTNNVPVVAERAMWWRAREGQWTAGHVGVGFTEGGTKWVTADGVAAANGTSDTYALVSNTENHPGLLKVTALFDDGTAPVERLFAIGANQRFTIRGRQRFPEVVGKGYSFIIESIGASPVKIVVDHSTYFDLDGRFWAMGTTSPGSKIR